MERILPRLWTRNRFHSWPLQTQSQPPQRLPPQLPLPKKREEGATAKQLLLRVVQWGREQEVQASVAKKSEHQFLPQQALRTHTLNQRKIVSFLEWDDT